MRKLVTILFILILIGCSGTKLAKTPSGHPETIYLNSDISTVKSKIANECTNTGLTIYQNRNREVVCGRRMDGSQAAFAKLAVGNSYSTTPVNKARFNLIKVEQGVKVQAVQWIESTTSFGQTEKMMLDQAKHFNALQNFLWRLCQGEDGLNCSAYNLTEYAIKQMFPGKTYMGLMTKNNVDNGIKVVFIADNSPADKSGLKEGDIITSYNGNNVDTVKEFSQSKFPAGTPVDLTILRNGKKHSISVTPQKK